jgi:ParB family transcriptional regulator, chromosome partitioning protein
MELELGQLDLRYAALRTRSAARERRLMAAIADVGQQMPIVVVRDEGRWVVVDGYKRVRVLGRLGQDTALATTWELSELEALMLERVLRSGESDSALEQGWLLLELSRRFGLGCEELARRFDRTPSWVSRRMSLVHKLPVSVQEHVRAGSIGAHAAMKYLVPLARANISDCERLANAIAPEKLTSRQMGQLYAAYAAAGTTGREMVLDHPMVALRAREESAEQRAEDKRPVEQLLEDLRIVGAVMRRACHRLHHGVIDDAEMTERDEARRAWQGVLGEVESLRRACDKELRVDAG